MVTTIRLPDCLHEELKGQAERKGMTFNAYVLSMLWDVQEGQSKKDAEKEKMESDRRHIKNVKPEG